MLQKAIPIRTRNQDNMRIEIRIDMRAGVKFIDELLVDFGLELG